MRKIIEIYYKMLIKRDINNIKNDISWFIKIVIHVLIIFCFITLWRILKYIEEIIKNEFPLNSYNSTFADIFSITFDIALFIIILKYIHQFIIKDGK